MAGTTVQDGGAVEAAFLEALSAVGIAAGDPARAAMLEHVRATMGTSKITVFRSLFGEEELAQRGNAAFEVAYAAAVGAGAIVPLPGAAETIAELRASGRKVALLTGFSERTRNGLLDALGWLGIADLALSPSQAGRGRPFPDMILTAILRLEITEVAAVAVAGDTAADVESALRAGSSIAAGVLTGADDADRLIAAGATHVLSSVAELAAVVAAT
jgi:phosphonatase-like hydrolase